MLKCWRTNGRTDRIIIILEHSVYFLQSLQMMNNLKRQAIEDFEEATTENEVERGPLSLNLMIYSAAQTEALCRIAKEVLAHTLTELMISLKSLEIYLQTSSRSSKMRYWKAAKLQHVKLTNLTLTLSNTPMQKTVCG